MAVNMAQKRGKKAQRRKQLAALAKREDAVHNSLSARVARASQAPLRRCYIAKDLFELGLGSLVVARGLTDKDLDVGLFLLDTMALGVKDVMFRAMKDKELARYIELAEAGSPMVDIRPADARKLLRDLVSWSKANGFAPHRDFAAVEQIFGDIDASASDEVFTFGLKGDPVLIDGVGVVGDD